MNETYLLNLWSSFNALFLIMRTKIIESFHKQFLSLLDRKFWSSTSLNTIMYISSSLFVLFIPNIVIKRFFLSQGKKWMNEWRRFTGITLYDRNIYNTHLLFLNNDARTKSLEVVLILRNSQENRSFMKSNNHSYDRKVVNLRIIIVINSRNTEH